jgi:hypothetical protein
MRVRTQIAYGSDMKSIYAGVHSLTKDVGFRSSVKVMGLALATLCVLIVSLLVAGCTGYVAVQPGYEDSSFAAQDDYVYYPEYEMYYSVSRHQYAYHEGTRWVTRPSPRGVSAEALRGSQSVRMDFHDSPAKHHENVVKQYPRQAPRQAPARVESRGPTESRDNKDRNSDRP